MISPPEDASTAPHFADSRDALIRQLREELIKTQMIVLELNDRILEKETDRIDAIAILGRVELVLEQKIDYIVELDQALNARIRELQAALTAAEARDRQRLAEIARICGERDREYTARDAIIQDLVQKLDAANKEIGRAHTMAGEFARDLSLTRDTLNAETAAHQKTRDELAATSTRLGATAQSLTATTEELGATRKTLEQTQQQLASERQTVATIKASQLWRLGRPWRALFGPKA